MPESWTDDDKADVWKMIQRCNHDIQAGKNVESNRRLLASLESLLDEPTEDVKDE